MGLDLDYKDGQTPLDEDEYLIAPLLFLTMIFFRAPASN
jgi:hypothetical protein